MYDIVSLGELLIDFTEAGVSLRGTRLFEQNAGGAVTNLLVAASRCGSKTAFIGKVGADLHGAFLRKTMEDAGVDMRALVVDPTVFTTLSFVALAENGEREFSFARKPGADTQLAPGELNLELLENTRIFHTGSLSLTQEPSRGATYRAIEIAKQAGALVSYDPNYRASLWNNEREAIYFMRSLVATADFIKLSEEETVLLTGETDPERAAAALCRAGCRVVAVTLGAKGALVRVGDETRFVPGFPSTVVDTTGAGDAFFGGFLFRYLSLGREIGSLTADDAAELARFGNAVASLCVEARGGIPSMPRLEGIKARLAASEKA